MALMITTKKEGFCRAGKRHHGTVIHPDGTFTEDQVAALKAEPNLIVEEVPDEIVTESEGNLDDNTRKGKK